MNKNTKALTVLQLLPVCLSLLLIGAHCLRYNQLVLFGVCAGLIPVLLVRQPLAARLIQVLLALAALEWLRSAYFLIHARMEAGAPWTRLAIILGAVVLLTCCSVLVFQSKVLKQRYRL